MLLSVVEVIVLASVDVGVVAETVVSFPDCLLASWTIDVANSGSLA